MEEVLHIIIINARGVDFGGIDMHQEALVLCWREEWGVENDGCVVIVKATWSRSCGVI